MNGSPRGSIQTHALGSNTGGTLYFQGLVIDYAIAKIMILCYNDTYHVMDVCCRL